MKKDKQIYVVESVLRKDAYYPFRKYLIGKEVYVSNQNSGLAYLRFVHKRDFNALCKQICSNRRYDAWFHFTHYVK